AGLVLLGVLLCSVPARAEDPDPWFGSDKTLHFGATATAAAAGYGQAALVFDGYVPRAATGAAFGLGLGIGKEVLDAAGLGDASWKDLAWDVAGTAVGVAVALSVDLLVRAASDKSRKKHDRGSAAHR